MSGVIKIEIEETTDKLRQLLKSSEHRKVKERIQVLYWLTLEPVTTTAAIASLRRYNPSFMYSIAFYCPT
ncbi:MAG: hypothetical protein QNJ72_05820 [Pleurocapsa sp. MO_226.B13]|nr:hypothetical protein [Pleurocapsa sp. MO_226.B13]